MKIKLIMKLIKFEHTIFALPFAYMGAILAAEGIPSWSKVLWITLAMVGARSAAMAWNRLLDWKVDAANPRTESRVLPQNLLSKIEVILFIVFSLALLLVAAWQLNPLAFKLSPLAVFLLIFYSYTKRFTWLCHLVLGFTLGMAPVGSWVGVTGEISLAPILVGIAVMFWVAGFDIIYAIQDLEFDREHGLYSIPVKFGLERSLRITVAFHTITFLLFAFIGKYLTLGWLYAIGIAIVGLLLYKENTLVKSDFDKVKFAFFNINSIVSITIFIFTLADYLFK
ncbi:4-hydroxybenzoate polyprenyltransferase [Selenihalanaerobacter shriftii]|uniref:4-hydroxybenzoate polyprenyltransferase n=1 Tax=Selenihalanaerobacter shriftii TaxID=142842 RepID=A0A1T4MMS5_9FIRM|nr:UbiA-like polyprenyltransferase [Selenihalanaerobacter shriftii]SJZ68008.1 4-hydroxybenzoate polyprenyltransferase [Selenihalanaerobacter shriftii]